MEKDNILIVGLYIFTLIINIFIIYMFFSLFNDLNMKIEILEKANKELNQENIDLSWQLDQVDQMICNNDMLDYEVE